jgi:hypothetical protein
VGVWVRGFLLSRFQMYILGTSQSVLDPPGRAGRVRVVAVCPVAMRCAGASASAAGRRQVPHDSTCGCITNMYRAMRVRTVHRADGRRQAVPGHGSGRCVEALDQRGLSSALVSERPARLVPPVTEHARMVHFGMSLNYVGYCTRGSSVPCFIKSILF